MKGCTHGLELLLCLVLLVVVLTGELGVIATCYKDMLLM